MLLSEAISLLLQFPLRPAAQASMLCAEVSACSEGWNIITVLECMTSDGYLKRIKRNSKPALNGKSESVARIPHHFGYSCISIARVSFEYQQADFTADLFREFRYGYLFLVAADRVNCDPFI